MKQTYKDKQAKALTADWLKDIGLDVPYFNQTHIKLLQAKTLATTLLEQNANLLSSTQTAKLEKFLKQMKHKNTREKLKPTHAYPILNIGTKINRQLFKQYKKLP